MAKKKQKKAAKRVAKRAGKRATKRELPAAKRAARKKPESPAADVSLPERNVVLPDVDSLKLTIDGFGQRIEAGDARVENLIAGQTELLAAIQARLDRIEAAQRAPPRDPSLDVPQDVVKQRCFLAGFCSASGFPNPTSAIIGLVMHDAGVFSAKDNVSPRNLFERIYAKERLHIAPKIRDLLERYGDPSAAAGKTPGRSSGKIAKELGDEFDRRFILIIKIGCGHKDPVKNGKKTNYHRYLTEKGRELFDNWPKWTDDTGGVGILDEGPAVAPSEPKAAGTADPKPEPAPEPDAGIEPTSPAP